MFVNVVKLMRPIASSFTFDDMFLIRPRVLISGSSKSNNHREYRALNTSFKIQARYSYRPTPGRRHFDPSISLNCPYLHHDSVRP